MSVSIAGRNPVAARSAAAWLAGWLAVAAAGLGLAQQKPSDTRQAPPAAAQPAPKPEPKPAEPKPVEPKPGDSKTGETQPGEAADDDPNQPAAPAPPKKFYEQEPFDNVILDKANDNALLKVMPLQFPERKRPPDSARVGKLKLRLFDERDDEYEVMWRNVERIELFEELVLAEANRLVNQAAEFSAAARPADAERALDEAYEFFLWLLRYYPGTIGLPDGVQGYLYVNAGSLFKSGRVAEAFGVLEELYQQNPAYQHRGTTATGVAAMEAVGGRLVKGYVDRQDYRSARLLLERLEKSYGNKLALIGTWRSQLTGIAAEKRDAAQAALTQKQFRLAHDTSREMMKVWPRISGGRELILEIARQYPLVVVGVTQPASYHDPASFDNPAARRTGRLMFRTLLEFKSRGAEGGKYEFLFGTVQQSDDRRQLQLLLDPSAAAANWTGFDVARELLNLADPAGPRYDPAWASLMSNIVVQSSSQVAVNLRRPHVLPQALLQTRTAATDQAAARYAVAEKTAAEQRFEPVHAGVEPKPVIVEHLYAEPREGVDALLKGKVDMLEFVLPNDALRLKADPAIVVGQYDFPTLHVLIPKTDHPFLGNKTFRRAVVYAINRPVILHKGLLGDTAIPGCRVISGPLPAGISGTDASAYAYDQNIAALPYDPVMAMILLKLTENQLGTIADEKKEAAPELKELRIAHPPLELPRFVCKQIQAQLELVGIKSKLVELPTGQTADPKGEFDLRYCELMIREPLVDLRRIFGTGGVAEAKSPYLQLALRQLEEAGNWKEVRDRLHELHRLMYEEANVIPLWQMVDHFAYQRGLTNVNERPVFLYDNVEQWRVIPPELEE